MTMRVLLRDEIPPRALCLLILKVAASSGELHGYEIANSIQQIPDNLLNRGRLAVDL